MSLIKSCLCSFFSSLTYCTALLFTASLFASLSWVCASFALFTLYYTIAGIFSLVGCLLFCSGKKRIVLSLLAGLVVLGSFVQTRILMPEPLAFSARAPTQPNALTFKISQYNKLTHNWNQKELQQWLEKGGIDILVMQEVVHPELLLLRKLLTPVLPYMAPFNMKYFRRAGPDGFMVFSRYNIENYETKMICVKACSGTMAVRFDLVLPDDERVRVYTVHTHNPIIPSLYEANYEELVETARWISEDADAERIIFIGDWNTTVYSPAFRDVLKEGALTYQAFGLLPDNTWPSFIPLKALRLPLDHILYKGALRLLDKHSGENLGSDHHSLIAEFEVE